MGSEIFVILTEVFPSALQMPILPHGISLYVDGEADNSLMLATTTPQVELLNPVDHR